MTVTPVVRVAKLFTLSFMAFEGTWRFQAGRMGVQNFQKSILGQRGLKADRLTFQEPESLNFPLTPGSLSGGCWDGGVCVFSVEMRLLREAVDTHLTGSASPSCRCRARGFWGLARKCICVCECVCECVCVCVSVWRGRGYAWGWIRQRSQKF